MLHYTPANCTDDYRRALIVMGGLFPVKRFTPWIPELIAAAGPEVH
jgi:hypothetical protein